MAHYYGTANDVTDEAVVCAEAVSIGGTTYYRGRARQVADPSVLGNTSPTYGVWTAVSKGGTRMDVVAYPGVPADTSEVAWDTPNGQVFSTTARTLYARYSGQGDLDDGNSAPIRLRYTGVLADGVSTQDWVTQTAPASLTVYRYEVIAHQYPPGDNVSLELRDAVGGGGSGTTLSLTSGSSRSGVQTLATPFAVAAGAVMAIRGDGQDAADVEVVLYVAP